MNLDNQIAAIEIRTRLGPFFPPPAVDFLITHVDTLRLLFNAFEARQDTACAVLAGELLREARKFWPEVLGATKLGRTVDDLLRVLAIARKALEREASAN